MERVEPTFLLHVGGLGFASIQQGAEDAGLIHKGLNMFSRRCDFSNRLWQSDPNCRSDSISIERMKLMVGEAVYDFKG